jgi:hypothetical protein
MSYREVSVIEIRELLRLWLEGRGLRVVARLSGTDRKTVRYADTGITDLMPQRLLCRAVAGIRGQLRWGRRPVRHKHEDQRLVRKARRVSGGQ